MGRAYSVRKGSIEKSGAKKGKIYTYYAKEIFKIGRRFGETSSELERVVEKAKQEEVPNEIINRALTKVRGGEADNSKEVTYEAFGPNGSTFVITCDTDNVNRTVGFIRSILNKRNRSLGVTNSVIFNYDYIGLLSFKYDSEEYIFELMINNDIDLEEIEKSEDEIIIMFNPSDMDKVKEVLSKENINKITFEKIGYFAKEEVNLSEGDLEEFNQLLSEFEEVDDVVEVFHNVKL